MTTLKTRTIAGHEITLTKGHRYFATSDESAIHIYDVTSGEAFQPTTSLDCENPKAIARSFNVSQDAGRSW